MSKAIPFDTLEYMEELTSSGMNIKKAEAITKATVKAFEQMADAKDIATKGDMQSIKFELKSLESKTETRLKDMEIRLIKWLVGAATAQAVFFFTFLRYFHPY